MQGSLSPFRFASPSRVARIAASASTFTSAPAYSARAIARLGELGEDRLEPVVALMMQMVGLGGGKQDAVDARGEQARPQAVRAGPEAFEDLGHGALEIGDRGLAAVQGREHVDQHDLPVEPREMIAEEGPHHVLL